MLMTAATPLLCVLLTLSGQAPAIREQHATAVWFEPQLMFHSLGNGRALPLGVEVGRQLTPRLLLSAAIAHLPIANISATQVSAGARWYFRDNIFTPYLAIELGVLNLEEDDTGGQTHTNVFAAAGPGAELTLPRGFSIMTDLQLGPENGGRVGTDERVWHFSAWYRIGVGYRF